MSTTNLFVELLVIGVGAAGWLILLTLTALGYDEVFVRNLLATPAAIVPAVVVIYLLGIIIDRAADAFLNFLRSGRKRARHFSDEDEALKVRGYVLAKSVYFASLWEYSRSRQRICRGWILNFTLIALTLNMLIVFRPEAFNRAMHLMNADPWQVSCFVSPMLIALAIGCWFAWEKLYDTELKRMKHQAELLREIDTDSRKN